MTDRQIGYTERGQRAPTRYRSEKMCKRLCEDDREELGFFCQRTLGHSGPHLALPSGAIAPWATERQS